MAIPKYPCSSNVLKVLLEGSGLTWSELCHSFGFGPHEHHEGPMEMANCLWDLNEAGLIQVDGIPKDGIWEFVDEQLMESYQGEPSDKRIRASDNWRRIQRIFSLELPDLDSADDSYRLTSRPLFGRPVDLPSRAEVFVLMPFRDDILPVYEDHVVKVTTSLSLSVMRADDLFTSNSVISDVWAGIVAARVILADCTGKNPNVFYEIGIAHALGKPVILLTQAAGDVPVDLRHIKYIVYKYTPRGMVDFENSLAETVKAVLRL